MLFLVLPTQIFLGPFQDFWGAKDMFAPSSVTGGGQLLFLPSLFRRPCSEIFWGGAPPPPLSQRRSAETCQCHELPFARVSAISSCSHLRARHIHHDYLLFIQKGNKWRSVQLKHSTKIRDPLLKINSYLILLISPLPDTAGLGS